MAVYISLGRFERGGVDAMKKETKRLERVISAIEATGVKMQLYLTLGRLDFVVVTSGNSDDAVLKAVFMLETLKPLRILETMKAMPPEKISEVFKSLP